jgi:hypothetical protein
MQDLTVLLQNLVSAEKVQSIPGKGFVAKRRVIDETVAGLVDYSLLTKEEREMST